MWLKTLLIHNLPQFCGWISGRAWLLVLLTHVDLDVREPYRTNRLLAHREQYNNFVTAKLRVLELAWMWNQGWQRRLDSIHPDAYKERQTMIEEGNRIIALIAKFLTQHGVQNLKGN